MLETKEFLHFVIFMITCLSEIWCMRFIIACIVEAKVKQKSEVGVYETPRWELLLQSVDPEYCWQEEKPKPSISELDSRANALLSELQAELTEDDTLSVQDYEEERVSFFSGKEYSGLATCNIEDGVAGPQRWIAMVIGIEGEYVHIDDGTRLWVKIEDTPVNHGDIVMLDVIRDAKRVEVVRATVIESAPTVTAEYAIPDEDLTPFLEEEGVI